MFFEKRIEISIIIIFPLAAFAFDTAKAARAKAHAATNILFQICGESRLIRFERAQSILSSLLKKNTIAFSASVDFLYGVIFSMSKSIQPQCPLNVGKHIMSR